MHIAFGSSHGFGCPLPALSAIQWAFCGTAAAAAALPAPPALDGAGSPVKAAPGAVKTEPAESTPNGKPAKKRRVVVEPPMVAELDAAGCSVWQSALCSSAGELPAVAQLAVETAPPASVWLRVRLLLSDAAEPGRRCHDVVFKVDAAAAPQEHAVWRRGRIGLETAWTAAKDTEAQLSVVSQVCLLPRRLLLSHERAKHVPASTPMDECLLQQGIERSGGQKLDQACTDGLWNPMWMWLRSRKVCRSRCTRVTVRLTYLRPSHRCSWQGPRRCSAWQVASARGSLAAAHEAPSGERASTNKAGSTEAKICNGIDCSFCSVYMCQEMPACVSAVLAEQAPWRWPRLCGMQHPLRSIAKQKLARK